jgi:sulfate transport system permease protein
VLLPEILPAWTTGCTLAFARGLGEYGSVVFIAENMPMRTEITPLLIMTKLDEFEYGQATAIARVFLLVSFSLMLVMNFLQRRKVTLPVLS